MTYTDEKLVELGEVAISLENIEEIESEFDGVSEVISESSANSAKKSLMVDHDFHVFTGETEIEQTLSTFDFLFYSLIVEHLDIVVEHLYLDSAEVDLFGILKIK
jgi:hypothetical protein